MSVTVANAYIHRVIDRLAAKESRLLQPWSRHSVNSYCRERLATLPMFRATDASRSTRWRSFDECIPSGNEFGGVRLEGVRFRLAYSRLW